MTPAEREVVERVVRELDQDVRLARTREEHMRLSARALTLRELLSSTDVQVVQRGSLSG